MVYGGLDGMITTFAVVTGVAGANLSPIVVMALGVANLIGDGLSMALGDYLGTKSELAFRKKEHDRELWEVRNNLEEEKQEMIDIYREQGMNEEDAKKVIEVLAQKRNEKAFVNIMMVEELGLFPPGVDEDAPHKSALVTFFSFALFGLVPLLPYLIAFIFQQDYDDKDVQNFLFVASIIMTFVFLFVLGVSKSKLTFQKWWKAGIETLCVGAIAAGASYLIGFLIGLITGNHEGTND